MHTINISQAGRMLSVSETELNLPFTLGSTQLMVSSNIPWVMEETIAWITLSETSGTADASVTLTYEANSASRERSGIITLRNNDSEAVIMHTINISQAGRMLSVSETELNLPFTLGSTQLMVSSNIPWVMEETIAWITLSETSGTADASVTLTYEANSASGERSGIITLRNNDSEAVIMHTINISQEGVPERALVVTPTELTLPPTIGSTMFTVTSTNVDWIIEEEIDWVTFDQTSGTADASVTLTYEANPTATSRDGTITFRSDDNGTLITRSVSVTQAGSSVVMVSPILEEEAVHIFPNPAGDWVHIEGIKGNGHVLTIRSLAGILLRSESLRSESLRVDERGASAIDISRFPRGVYIFTIRGPQGSVIRRLIKQ